MLLKNNIKNISFLRTEEILKQLIKTNTENPPGNEKDIVMIILDYFKKYNLEKEVIDHGENRATLSLKIKGKTDKSVAFVGHIDTVPVENRDSWKVDPFSADKREDYIFGRGSADMKGGVTAMIITALYLLENNIKPEKNLYFCFTADEESGGLGAKAIVKNEILKDVDFIFVPEPTGRKLGLAEKGALWLNINASGKPAHASMPGEGINAVEELFLFIRLLKKEIESDKRHFLLGRSSAVITTIKGGVKTNVIPEKAEATLDIRTVPGDEHDVILKKADQLIREFQNDSGVKIEIEIENNRPPVEVAENDKNIIKLKKTFKKFGFDTNVKGLNFYTDASQIIPAVNCPFVIFGPGEDKMAHQTDEKTSLQSVEETARVFIDYIV